jgi:hypothetical protein
MREAVKKRIDSLKRSYRSEPISQPQSLDTAAQVFGLDLSDNRQRERLLYFLAEMAFGKGKRGRRKDSKSWTGGKLIELALLDEDYCYNKISDVKIAKLIFAEHKEFHSVETIRRRLPEARTMLELWREKMMDHVDPPEGWNEDGGDDDDYGRDDK